ncbi:GlxA family transcriptional regulator [Chromobacterium haemolyticum]|uniref:GlxA family transcriptional regulator n=1 Tax=Chromobacterium haemolyticum TaxID=394935 RepID=A0ABS3GTG5_9NEIS|nr:GlxA family transcriptional regulator [Chromobacterium haemolyticum]MBK0417226.1 GlxA family transcriptional regulator [Chromobacterium haemolyticum]MBO0418351.1 GlxA family transcriptional regulator [Chromobacterium haemolyticum]MBO0501676.1 GlxA family transcriptional regulator [Chromobacterium haemolyticum]QOD84384.1 GlxA family transcriptional regulator [Chromobacterium haemolyticum]
MESQQTASLSHIAFLLLDQFSMIAFSNAVEPLRMANYLSRKKLYRWSLLSADGKAVNASNGLCLSPVSAPGHPQQYDMLIVCGGCQVREAATDKVLALIRRFATQGVPLGSICTGAFALAQAGVLNGYRCAIHWENLLSIREEFPRTQFTSDLFVLDRDRFTCSGGTAPLDFMCHLIGHKGGKSLAADVLVQFIVDRLRDDGDRQHIPLLARIGAGHEALQNAVLSMENNIENPCSLESLAEELGVSLRHLERLFKRHLSATPAQYYLDLRLRRARELLLQTNMSVMEVTVACGFLSSSHFSKSYRGLFGYPPSHERQRYLAVAGAMA